MIDSFITSLFLQHVGRYFKHINKHQIETSLLRGTIEIRDLELSEEGIAIIYHELCIASKQQQEQAEGEGAMEKEKEKKEKKTSHKQEEEKHHKDNKDKDKHKHTTSTSSTTSSSRY